MSWGRTDVPVYCVHCALQDIIPIEATGYPIWMIEPPDEFGKAALQVPDVQRSRQNTGQILRKIRTEETGQILSSGLRSRGTGKIMIRGVVMTSTQSSQNNPAGQPENSGEEKLLLPLPKWKLWYTMIVLYLLYFLDFCHQGSHQPHVSDT